MTKPSEKTKLYRPDYNSGTLHSYWATIGPGVHQQAENREQAYSIAAALNAAYALGYADGIHSEKQI